MRAYRANDLGDVSHKRGAMVPQNAREDGWWLWWLGKPPVGWHWEARGRAGNKACGSSWDSDDRPRVSETAASGILVLNAPIQSLEVSTTTAPSSAISVPTHHHLICLLFHLDKPPVRLVYFSEGVDKGICEVIKYSSPRIFRRGSCRSSIRV